MARGRGQKTRAFFISDVHLLAEGEPGADELSARFGEFLDHATPARAGLSGPDLTAAPVRAGRSGPDLTAAPVRAGLSGPDLTAAPGGKTGHPTYLYILGDLFNYWFEARLRIPRGLERDCERIREAAGKGLKVIALPGNRDFLLGPAFEHATGAEVAPEETVLTLGGKRILLTHGDALATADHRFQLWKRFSRSPGFRRFASGVPAWPAERIACALRAGSEIEKRKKPSASMGFADRALRSRVAMGADVVIAGHVHEPAERVIEAGGKSGRLVVLGSWDSGPGAYAEWDGRRLSLVT